MWMGSCKTPLVFLYLYRKEHECGNAPEERDDSRYLKWRKEDETSPRMRRVTMALEIAGLTALTLPHYFTADKTVVQIGWVAGMALLCIGFAIGLSKIHSY